MAVVSRIRVSATLPAPWQPIALALATVLVVAALTSVPAHLGGRRPLTAIF
ncbi:hypothetical protein ACWEPC_05900 [Nonomuraea sp. NPDC004297]